VKTSRSFAPEAGSIPGARRFVLAAAGDVDKYRHDAIAVMGSELAMNAVQYARTEFTVTTEITGGTLRVEVTDSAPGAPVPGPLPSARSLHGRGLFIVGQLSDTWGISPSPAGPGKTVWFQTALRTGATRPPR
jgi:anti-sigma regulatory factor (Ser/Thr protein kinase)